MRDDPTITRRRLLQGVGGLSLLASSSPIVAAAAHGMVRLPDKANFIFEGAYLNAAYCHAVGRRTRDAADRYLQNRMLAPETNWPVKNPRDDAVAQYAKLINAHPDEVAVVPSTLEGENLIAASLGLGPHAGVVTNPLHYDASLVMYGELHKAGMPLALVAPVANQIDYQALEAAITHDTRLVAVSLVSSDTGYLHDLKTICEIAHGKGALVYADVIQAVGAIPFDVRASGVDFCCAGTYKWLMGEFGLAFLYVRSDRLPGLKRVQVGWRGLKSYSRHYLPYDTPGPLGGEWELGTDTASVFEVSTPNWSGLAAVGGALTYIDDIGVEAIELHRQPLLSRLQEELPKHGFVPLTPRENRGPYAVFSYPGARVRFHDALQRAKITVTLYKDKIRISPSVHNDMAEIDRLLNVLCA
jgi:selenocysteine lyase/cysteine desulfurase